MDKEIYCFESPNTYLKTLELIKFYYYGLSESSPRFQYEYQNILEEFTLAAVIPRVSNEEIRSINYEGNLLQPLLLQARMEAEEIYDTQYETHDDFIIALRSIILDFGNYQNEGLYLDTLEFLMYLGDFLKEDESPSEQLSFQDRYYPVFLLLSTKPNFDSSSIKEVFSKGTPEFKNHSHYLLKAAGIKNQLSEEEILALVLYDFILIEDEYELDIQISDIMSAREIFVTATQLPVLSKILIGGFDDNQSYELFQFFNIEYNRKGFHEFCLLKWEELCAKWNNLKTQSIIERLKNDFHKSTYTKNQLINDYISPREK